MGVLKSVEPTGFLAFAPAVAGTNWADVNRRISSKVARTAEDEFCLRSPLWFRLCRLRSLDLGRLLLCALLAAASFARGTGAQLPPPAAGSVGYTTLALNSDFTQQLPENWLGGCPNGANGKPVNLGDNAGAGHTWFLNLWWSATYQRCSVRQASDPKYGGTILDIPWTVQAAYGNIGAVIETASWDATTITSFPIGSYYEAVARMTPLSPHTYMALYTWGPGAITNQDCGCAMEWDVMETAGNDLNGYDSAVHNWGAGGQGAFILYPWTNLAPGTGFNPADYNTYALRVLYDGWSNAVGCTYINNVFQTCQQLPGGVVNAEPNAGNFIVIQNACNSSGCNPDGTKQHIYVQSIRVWSCADNATTQCATGALLAPPTPGSLTDSDGFVWSFGASDPNWPNDFFVLANGNPVPASGGAKWSMSHLLLLNGLIYSLDVNYGGGAYVFSGGTFVSGALP